jgi:acetyl-CoA acetyltransferase
MKYEDVFSAKDDAASSETIDDVRSPPTQGFPDSAKPNAAGWLHPTTSGTAKNVLEALQEPHCGSVMMGVTARETATQDGLRQTAWNTASQKEYAWNTTMTFECYGVPQQQQGELILHNHRKTRANSSHHAPIKPAPAAQP